MSSESIALSGTVAVPPPGAGQGPRMVDHQRSETARYLVHLVCPGSGLPLFPKTIGENGARTFGSRRLPAICVWWKRCAPSANVTIRRPARSRFAWTLRNPAVTGAIAIAVRGAGAASLDRRSHLCFSRPI